jgi:hypothetical protein
MNMDGVRHTYGAGVPQGQPITEQGCDQVWMVVESISVVIDSYQTTMIRLDFDSHLEPRSQNVKKPWKRPRSGPLGASLGLMVMES